MRGMMVSLLLLAEGGQAWALEDWASLPVKARCARSFRRCSLLLDGRYLNR